MISWLGFSRRIGARGALILAAAIAIGQPARTTGASPSSGGTSPTATSGAETITYRIDPARSTVQFTLPATLHTVEGKTSAVSGSFTRPATAAGESFHVTGKIMIAARTLDTGNGSRDKRMRAESLAVDTYPEIVFVPSRGVGKGLTFAPGTKSTFTLEGQLTVRGVTKPVSLETTARFAEGALSADGRTQLRFADFGVPDPSNFFLHVKPALTVSVHLEASADH